MNLLQYYFCFVFWFFGHEAHGILAPRPGIEPTPTALEGKVLTTGPPGKSPDTDPLMGPFHPQRPQTWVPQFSLLGLWLWAWWPGGQAVKEGEEKGAW